MPGEKESSAERSKRGKKSGRATQEEAMTDTEPSPLPDEEDFDVKTQELIAAAHAAEAQGPDKAVETWRKVAQAAPRGRLPRRQLARLNRQLERWNALIDTLKELVERIPEDRADDKIATLFEMADVYRERLRLDVMVIGTLNQILQLDGANVRAMDALAAEYEQVKRWPDLIGVLQKKAGAIEDSQDKVALLQRVAELFLEKFANQAEAIKVYEKILSIEPDHPQAIAFLKQMYEKRRDWEKLIGIAQREVTLVTEPAERTRRLVEVAKLASDKLRKPSVSIDLWRQVVDTDPDNVEALVELEKLYEREKQWEDLAKVLDRQVELAADAPARATVLGKLGNVYAEKLQDNARAIIAWKALLQADPQNRRAQDALRKVCLEARAYDDLEAFYAEAQRWEELIRLFERQTDFEDQSTKILLHFRCARLWREKLEKEDRAARAYEKVLGIDAKNLQAAEALIPIYRAAKDYKRLASVLQVQADQTDDPEEHLDRLRALAEVYEQNLNDRTAAFTQFESALDIDWRPEWIRQGAERLAKESGSFRELAAAYEKAVTTATGPHLLPLLKVLASTYEEHLGDVEAATRANCQILDIEGDDLAALDALERLYTLGDAYADLIRVLEKKLKLADTSEARREILGKLAFMYEEEIKDPDKAVAAYQSLLQEGGDDLDTLRALDRLYEGGERWSDLAAVLPRELALVPAEEGKTLVELKLRLGRVRQERLGDVDGAIAAYADVLELEPLDDTARAALESLLSDTAHQVDVARILEPVYRQTEEWERLVQIHEVQLVHETETFARAELLARVAQILADRIGDEQRAFEAISRCFRENPRSEQARDDVERLAGVIGRHKELAALYEEALERVGREPIVERQLLLKMASLQEDRLGDAGKAIELYDRVLRMDGEDRAALDALEGLYARAERWGDLVDIFRRKGALAVDPEERSTLWLRVATLWEEVLGNPVEAIAAYIEVLTQDDQNVVAMRALARLYEQKGEVHELGNILQRQLTLTQDRAEQVDLMLRLAALRAAEGGGTGAALDTYRQVLDLDAENEHAIAAIEQFLGHTDHRLDAAQILEPIYRTRGATQKLIGVYGIMAEQALDPTRRVELLLRVGEIEEISDQPQQAFRTYSRALHEDPGAEDTVERIERLARSNGMLEDLVALYADLASDRGQGDLAVTFETKTARILERDIGDLARATKAYETVLQMRPDHLDALVALEELHRRTDSFTSLVDVLRRKAELVESVSAKKDAFFRAAQIYEDILESADGAADIYHKVLEIDDTDAAALGALERIYLRQEKWESLKDVYVRKANLAQDPDDKKQSYYVLGQVYESELHDVDRAIETYLAVLDIDSEDTTALHALERLYGQAERWHDLHGVLERQLPLARVSAERVSLQHRMGELWQTKLDEAERAVTHYEQALVIDPQHAPTLQALDGMLKGPAALLAARVLEPTYERAMEWEKLVAVLEVIVGQASLPAERVMLLHRIGDLSQRYTQDVDRAFSALARAVREDSGDERTLDALEKLAAGSGRFADVVRIYEEEIDRSLDPARELALALRIGGIVEGVIVDPDLAIEKYRRVLEMDAENRPALVALDRLYQQRQRPRDLSDVLGRLLRITDSENDSIALQLRLADIHERDLADPAAALECYRAVLSLRPDHEQTLAALERMFDQGKLTMDIAGILEPRYRMVGDWEKLVRMSETLLGGIEGRESRLLAVQRIAEICEQRIGDPERAFVWWGRMLREDPTSELAVEELERLAGLTGGWSDLVGIYDDLATASTDREVSRALLMRRAVVEEEKLRDNRRAENAYLRILEIGERDADALAALDRIYQARGEFEPLAKILERRIAAADSPDDAAALYLRLGPLREDALGDIDGAVQAYEEVLKVDSHNLRVIESLEHVHFRRHRWEELSGVYERMLDAVHGDGDRADCYARMAKIASDALGKVDRAKELWGNVLDLRGEDSIALGALADLHEASAEWREFVDVLERQVRITDEAGAQVRLLQRLGRVWGEQLGRERNALECWEKILEIDPRNVPALRAMAALHRAAGSWDSLAETLERLIAAGNGVLSPAEQRDLYAEIGHVKGEFLYRPGEAIEAWRSVLQIAPADLPGMAALEGLLRREERWRECIDVLERRASVLDDKSAQVDVLLQAAPMWQDKLGNVQEATKVYERALEKDPARIEASLALEPIYREKKAWAPLIELLLARVDRVDSAAVRIGILQSAARIYEQELNEPDSAYVVLQAAFKEDYQNEDSARDLERLAGATGRWNDLLGEYTQIAQTIQEPTAACSLWVKIGRWYGDQLGHMDYAIESLKQALDKVPNEPSALAGLATYYRKTERWKELVSTVSALSQQETDPEKKVDLYIGQADVYEDELGQTDRAIAAYQRALAVDERSVEALRLLERLYRKHQMWDQLIDVIGKRAQVLYDTGRDPEEVMTLRVQAAELIEDRLGDSGRSIEAYRDVLAVDSHNVGALKALERLYEKTGRTEGYLSVLEQQLDISNSDAQRVALHQRMAATWEERLGRLDRAEASYQEILRLDERNGEAFKALERIERQEKRWESLVETLRRHAPIVFDPAERVALYQERAEILEEHLRDLNGSVDAYNELLAFDAQHLGALGALSRLYEQTEAWDKASQATERLLELATDATSRVQAQYRLGRLAEAHLGDVDQAEERYAAALSINSTFQPAMLALAGIYRGRGEWLKAAQYIVRALEQTQNVLEKARLGFEGAEIYRTKIGDDDRAAELYAATLVVDPDHLGAGEPLAEIYYARQRWAELEPVLELLVRKSEKRESREKAKLFLRLAKATEALGNAEKALKNYKLAYDLDSSQLDTMWGMAALHYAQNDTHNSFKHYQAILVHHRDTLSHEQTVDIFYRLGQLKLKEGERRKALNMFEKALEVDAAHRPTLKAIVEIQTAQGDWEAVITATRAMMGKATEQEQFDMLQEIGGIYRNKLTAVPKAIAAYVEAMQIKPTDVGVLHTLLELYTETKQWKNSKDMLVKMAELERDPARKGTYYHAAGVIDRDEMKSADQAVEHFNQALDCYFQRPETFTPENMTKYLRDFESIDRILTQKKDWKQLERSYRKMIKRMPQEGHVPLKVSLWHNLGEIYRTRQKDWNSGIAAFEIAAQMDPGNEQRHQILAELYVLAGPDHAEKAVREHQTLIRTQPYRIESYRALYQIYRDSGEMDKAWCVAAALVFLRKAEPEEQHVFEQGMRRELATARSRLTDEIWLKHILHPDQDRYVSAIFGLLSRPVYARHAQPHKNFQIKQKEKLDLLNNPLVFAKVYHFVHSLLNLPPTELYIRSDQPIGLLMAATSPPSFVVGLDLLQGKGQKELAFAAAKQLAYVRPEHLLCRIVPTAGGLKLLLQAAIKSISSEGPAKAEGPDAEWVKALRQAYQREPVLSEQLGGVVRKFLSTKAEADLYKWLASVELTANRAGLVACGDLDVATKAVSTEPVPAGGVQSKDKVKDLVAYSVTEDYFAVRNFLGIGVSS